MFIAPDDAKTDVILVGAVVVFGPTVIRLFARLPFYPDTGLTARLFGLLWIVALTALVPILLARYRGDGRSAFGLDGTMSNIGAGLLLAVPVIAAGALGRLQLGAATDTALLGRLGPALLPAGGIDLTTLVLATAELVLLSAGTLLAIAFVSVRAREGFPRSPDMPLTQLVRTVGLAAVAIGSVLGVLDALRLRSMDTALGLVIDVAAIAVLLLLVDRRISSRVMVPRATILAPVVVVVLARVLASGGLFGDLFGGLLTGALALGVTVAVAALAQTRDRAWLAVPLVVAAHWWVPFVLAPIA